MGVSVVINHHVSLRCQCVRHICTHVWVALGSVRCLCNLLPCASWCQLLGSDSAEAAWNYCAPVVDYDALRKEVVGVFADRAAQVQGLVASFVCKRVLHLHVLNIGSECYLIVIASTFLASLQHRWRSCRKRSVPQSRLWISIAIFLGAGTL